MRDIAIEYNLIWIQSDSKCAQNEKTTVYN